MKTRNFLTLAVFCAAAVLTLAACSSLKNNLPFIGNALSGLGSTGDKERAAQGCGSESPQEPVSSASARQKGKGKNVKASWPSDSDWDAYGLKGLKLPAGSTVENVALYQGVYMVVLYNAGEAAYNDLTAQIKKITGAKVPYSDVKTGEGRLTEYQYGSHVVTIAVNFVEMEILIRIIR
ncbi:MAG: hypothetical protein LBT84_03450 [Spirochaetia bacterium]|jgi:hypothetical protein|nr:hypothetical protein [Spirochaetia bacterium]